MELIDVVRKLIGAVNPIGETNEDERRLDNLKVMIVLTDQLLTDIDDVAYKNKNRHESSMKRAANVASDFYKRLGIQE